MLKWIGGIASLVSIWQVFWDILISIVMGVLSFWGVLKNGFGWQLALVFAFCVAIVFGYVLFILHCLAVIFYRKMKNSKIEKESELRIKEKEKDHELEKEKIKAKGEEERKTLAMTFSNEERADIRKMLDNLNPAKISYIITYAPEMANHFRKQYNLSGEEEDILIEIFKEFKPNRTDVNDLLAKLIEKMKDKEKKDEENKDEKMKDKEVVSLQLIKFLNSITNDDLKVIKEQFRYVANTQPPILLYNNANLLPKDKELLGKDGNIKFFNSIWHGEVKYKPTNTNITLSFNKSQKCIAVSTLSKKEYVLCGFGLTEIGLELHTILKEEIEKTPDEYIEEVARNTKKTQDMQALVKENITTDVLHFTNDRFKI